MNGNLSVNKRIIVACFRFVAVTLLLTSSQLVNADQLYNDDIVVKGSICVGVDCNSGENFSFDTIRMKENNLRIRFTDTSSSGGFPTRDWEITVNDSTNGGANKFSITNVDAGTTPFTIMDGANNNSLYIGANDFIGLGTTTPVAQIHAVTGNSPTIRLDQDVTSGFTAQAWDVAGNETNFFVRDVTSGNKLPLRIQVGAPNSSIHVAPDGDVGFRTSTPDGLLDIAHPSDANNHAVLVSPTGNFGINIDNGFLPRGLFDVQATNGKSKLMVQSDGKVGLGLEASGTANGLFDVQISGVSKFLVTDGGNIAIGKSSVSGSNRLEVRDSGNTKDLMTLTDTGELGIGTSTFPTLSLIEPTLAIKGKASTHHGVLLDTPSTDFTGSLIFAKNGTANWFLSSRNEFVNGNDRFVIFNKNIVEVMSFEQGGKIGFGVLSVGTNNAIEHSNGAALTTGGAWTNGSSRETKNHVAELAYEEAYKALEELEPVTFEYKKEPGETYVGFIAEDAPELVATNNRKGIASMDVVAVLTKVVQDQQKTIKELNERLAKLERGSK